jgi:hypothetical protein
MPAPPFLKFSGAFLKLPGQLVALTKRVCQPAA